MSDYAGYVNTFASALLGCGGRDPSASARQVAALLQIGNREVRNAVEQVFSDAPDDARWIVPIHHVVVHNLVTTAIQADEAQKQSTTGASGKLSDAATYLQSSVFSDTLRKGGGMKRYAALEVANTLFRVTFKLKNLRLADSIMKGVTHNLAPESQTPFQNFPMSQQVTYKFFQGRIAVFNEEYVMAADALQFACNHCHREARSQMRRILHFLIPVQMLLGKLPSMQLRQKYQMHSYDTLIEAVKAGDVQTFEREVDKNMYIFCAQGTFFLLEKLQLTVLRRLLMRCCVLHVESCGPSDANPHHFPLDNFVTALRWQGHADVEFEEVVLVVANLIHLKYVKGYISHVHRKLVLAKKGANIFGAAFPPLSSIDIAKIGV